MLRLFIVQCAQKFRNSCFRRKYSPLNLSRSILYSLVYPCGSNISKMMKKINKGNLKPKLSSKGDAKVFGLNISICRK